LRRAFQFSAELTSPRVSRRQRERERVLPAPHLPRIFGKEL
jgi:hypothetical protein